MSLLLTAKKSHVLAADRGVLALVRPAGVLVVVMEDLSALADRGLVDLAAAAEELADPGVDLDVAGAAAAFLAADGG